MHLGTRKGALVALTSTGGVITQRRSGARGDLPGAGDHPGRLPGPARCGGRPRRHPRHDDRPLGAGHRDQHGPRRQDLVAEQARQRGPPPHHRGDPGTDRDGSLDQIGLDTSRPADWKDVAMEATPAQIRRALVRAERGAALDVEEAAALLAARDESLDRLCAVAARVRDAGLIGAGRPGVVTYSPKVFIPITRLCRDRCHYCTFVDRPGQAVGGRSPTSRPTRSSRSPARARSWAAWRRCSPSATGPRTAGPRPGCGSTSRATTRRSTTSARWRSGCSRRPACCRTSTPASCRGRR